MSKESSESSKTLSSEPKSSPEIDLDALLPEGIDDVNDLGLMRTTNKRYPVVNDIPVRQARQFLRETQTLKSSIAEGANDEKAQEHLRGLLPMLADMARTHKTKRVRLQASKEIREIIKMLEGPPSEAGKGGGGGFGAGHVNLQINIDTTGDGPIISMGEAPDE